MFQKISLNHVLRVTVRVPGLQAGPCQKLLNYCFLIKNDRLPFADMTHVSVAALFSRLGTLTHFLPSEVELKT